MTLTNRTEDLCEVCRWSRDVILLSFCHISHEKANIRLEQQPKRPIFYLLLFFYFTCKQKDLANKSNGNAAIIAQVGLLNFFPQCFSNTQQVKTKLFIVKYHHSRTTRAESVLNVALIGTFGCCHYYLRWKQTQPPAEETCI